MAFRQLIQLEKAIDNTNLGNLNLTQETIDVAQISNITNWPALRPWGVNDSDTGFKERVGDGVMIVSGHTPVSGRFFADNDGGESYSIQNGTMNLINSNFDTSGSFTVACLVGSDLGIGSFSTPPPSSAWFLASNEGKLRWEVGGSVSGGYDSYTGPLLNSTTMTTVIFVYDRQKGAAKVRVNGVDYLEAVVASPTILNELSVGGINAGTSQQRNGKYREIMAFNKVLNDTELSTLENYFNSLK